VQKERVAAVVEVLGEAEGQIRIEDVLPLFPDFVTIDAFKAAICASLEDYNAQIEGLKTEMADSTRIADALRYFRREIILTCPATCKVPGPCSNCCIQGCHLRLAGGLQCADSGPKDRNGRFYSHKGCSEVCLQEYSTSSMQHQTVNNWKIPQVR